jgi:hypothetical protein
MLQNLEGDIVGGDVVEYNPQCDTYDGITSLVAAKLVRELAAKMIYFKTIIMVISISSRKWRGSQLLNDHH